MRELLLLLLLLFGGKDSHVKAHPVGAPYSVTTLCSVEKRQDIGVT